MNRGPVIALILLVMAVAPTVPLASAAGIPDGENADHWRALGRAAAQQRTAEPPKNARNVIFFVGDGMGISTVTAARILQGQLSGRSGEENVLAFERFPYTALSKTYTSDAQTAESAGTMTAMITGVKTRSGSLSVDQVPERGKCKEMTGHELPTLLEEAELAGMSTGIVSTARITHATPAATYAHVSDRDWESDANMSEQALSEGCADIARQLVDFSRGDGIDVVLGGGRENFMTVDQQGPEAGDGRGKRKDGRDLIGQWRARNANGKYVWNTDEFAAVDSASTAKLLGLFEMSHMEFEADRTTDKGGEPSLEDMTRKAIAMLARNKRGYFLMVEAGRIDHGHHASNAYRALHDAVELSDAVAAAVELTDRKDTLIVVTADHSHTFTIVGYPVRGNPIFDIARDESGAAMKDALGLPYTTLSYANGPGYPGASTEQAEGPKQIPHFGSGYKGVTRGRPDLSSVDTKAPGYLQESAVPSSSETHGGEDVPVYATGPGAQRFHGVIEQNVLYWLMRESLSKQLPKLEKEEPRKQELEKQ